MFELLLLHQLVVQHLHVVLPLALEVPCKSLVPAHWNFSTLPMPEPFLEETIVSVPIPFDAHSSAINVAPCWSMASEPGSLCGGCDVIDDVYWFAIRALVSHGP